MNILYSPQMSVCHQMSLFVDTFALLAFLDADQPRHTEVIDPKFKVCLPLSCRLGLQPGREPASEGAAPETAIVEGWTVAGFEQAFGDVERASGSALKSAAGLTRLVKRIQKAAREGNIAHLKRAQSELDTALDGLRQAVANARSSWPYLEDDEERYLKDHYATEFRITAEEMGLDIRERDGKLISSPSIVRILPGERAVKIDGKKVPAIRPSHLARLLLENQGKRSRYSSDRFLESLHTAYSEIMRDESSHRLMPGDGPVVPLARIYRLFTVRPGAGREYDRTDFARDLYVLDSSGPKRTRKGAAVSFPSSTGTRQSGSGLFTFVAPDGQEIRYYGIKFTEGG